MQNRQDKIVSLLVEKGNCEINGNTVVCHTVNPETGDDKSVPIATPESQTGDTMPKNKG